MRVVDVYPLLPKLDLDLRGDNCVPLKVEIPQLLIVISRVTHSGSVIYYRLYVLHGGDDKRPVLVEVGLVPCATVCVVVEKFAQDT